MRHAADPIRAYIAALAVIVGIGSALFLLWMHPAVLDPTNRGWLLLGDDRGQGAIGTAAYFRATGSWPSLRQPLLSAPDGLPLLFTDSIPLIGLLARPFVGGSAVGLQLIGLWYLLCTMMQAAFAWLLVRPHANDRLGAVIGTALLAGMPVLFNRYPHASLCAQWLILWALWVFVDPARSRAGWWWPAVLGTAAMVHSYLLLDVAMIWGASILAALAAGPDRARTLARAAATALVPIAILAANGVFDGPFASTRTYGSWPVALDAWWNPQNQAFTLLMPSTPDRTGVGFEGLQYLGAGLLAVVIGACVVAARDRGRVSARADLRRLPWLIPVLVLVAPVAIGAEPMWRGEILWSAPLPIWIVDLLDPVRAAARLMWPFTYAVAFAAIAIVVSLRSGTLFLGVALAIQVVDLSPMIGAIRSTSARADDRSVFTRTRDPRWTAYIGRAAAVDFQPPDPYADLPLLQEITWRAVDACRPVLFTYASRQSAVMRRRLRRGMIDTAAGRVPADRMIVFLQGTPPAALAASIERLDGIAVLPPRRAAPPSTLCRVR